MEKKQKPCIAMQGLNIIRMCLYAALCPGTKIEHPEKVLLLYFGGLLGDGIMFLDMLKNYIIFCKNNGIRLVVACREETEAVFRYAGFCDNITYVELEKARAAVDYPYFVDRVRALSGYRPEILIHVRASYATEDVLIHAVHSGQKICVRSDNVDFERTFLCRYFVHHTYDEVIHTDNTEDQLTHYGRVLRKYFMPDYCSKVFEFPPAPIPCGLTEKGYILVCPGASTPHKAWPAERYSEVVRYLLKHYPQNIVICGVEADRAAATLIETEVRDSRIKNLVGKSSLCEWFALIGNACLVIANESGAVHAAAASKVPCVCIGAQEFGDEFLPYRPEFIRKSDRLPIVERGKRLPCYGCKGNKHFRNGGIRRCYAKNGIFPCVCAVSVEQIIQAATTVLDGK